MGYITSRILLILIMELPYILITYFGDLGAKVSGHKSPEILVHQVLSVALFLLAPVHSSLFLNISEFLVSSNKC